MKKSIPSGYQFFPPNLTGASNELAMALLPKAISATKTGRQTINTINIYKTTKAAPPP
jgi:hypothetical protein